MKIFNVEPGSGDWARLRIGIPTASQFDKILTPKTQKFSTQARAYAFRLIAEKLLNESTDTLDFLEHVQRGKELEPTAVQMFELVEEVKTSPVGFVTTDDMSCGASPDRLIDGAAAGLEVKCPASWTHLEYLVDGFGSNYVVQAQGQNYVCEFEWVARYSFHPKMPPRLVKTYRDEALITNLKGALDQFNEMKAEIEAKVRALGYFEEHPHLLTAWEQVAQDQEDIFGLRPLRRRAAAPQSPPAHETPAPSAAPPTPEQPHSAPRAAATASPAGDQPEQRKEVTTGLGGPTDEPAGADADHLRVPLSANPSMAELDYFGRQVRMLADEWPQRLAAIQAANEDGLTKLRAVLPDVAAEVERVLAGGGGSGD